MNLPNKLTLLRIAIVPLFVYVLFLDNFYAYLTAFLLFVGAALTDMADGHLARKHDMVTGFGIFMDPLADKILAAAALISFIILQHVEIIPVVLILVREFSITGLRLVGSSQKVSIPATGLAKFKTFLQLSMIILMLLYIALMGGLEIYNPKLWKSFLLFDYKFYFDLYLWLAAIVTVWTGIDYLIKYRTIVKTALK